MDLSVPETCHLQFSTSLASNLHRHDWAWPTHGGIKSMAGMLPSCTWSSPSVLLRRLILIHHVKIQLGSHSAQNSESKNPHCRLRYARKGTTLISKKDQRVNFYNLDSKLALYDPLSICSWWFGDSQAGMMLSERMMAPAGSGGTRLRTLSTDRSLKLSHIITSERNIKLLSISR